MASGIKLAPLLTEIKVNIDSFKNDMEKAKTIGVTEADKISRQLSGVAKTGENLSKIGGALTLGVTAPLIGIGAASASMAVDFETSFAKVTSLLDKNSVDYDKYKQDILNASSESKVAVGEFSEAVYGSISAGVDQTKAIGFTTDAMKLAKGGFTDGAKAVDVLTTAINGYGLQAEDAARISDLLITTQNLGKTTVDELASSMGTVIPVASSVNFEVEELSVAYAQLTKNGIATAESGTYLKAMLSELGKSGSTTDKILRDLTGKGFADLKKEGVSTTDILRMLSESAEQDGKTLKDMFGSVEAGSAALVLAKGDGKEYDEMLKAMGDSAGATQEAFEKMDATPAEQMKGAVNELKNAGIKLGTAFIPVIEKIADVIGNVADKFSGLSEEQQENVVKWGIVLAAAGPVLGLLGGAVTTVTGVASAIGGLSAALGVGAAAGGVGLAASFGAAVVAAAPLIAGVAAVGVAGYGVYKTMTQEVIPSVDLFADKVTYASGSVTKDMNGMSGSIEADVVKISEATQTAVQAYMDMDDAVSLSLYEQQITQATVTAEIATDTIGKFQGMADTILAGEQTNHRNRLTEYQQFFTDSAVLTESEEQGILNTIELKHQERELKVNESMGRISEIYNTAYLEHRTLTEVERAEINLIQEGMRTDAVNTLSATEAEAAVIRERMKAYQGRLSVEMASELITKAIETKDAEILAATEKCDETIRQAARMKEAGDLTQEQYDRIVKDAQQSETDTIKAAEAACQGIIDSIAKNDPTIIGMVNTQTGAIKTAWDNVKTHLSNIWEWIKETAGEAKAMAADIAARDEMTGEKKSSKGPNFSSGGNGPATGPGKSASHYNGLDYVPYDGYQATLHEGERVLTKEQNQGRRKAIPENLTVNFNRPVESAAENTRRIKNMLLELGVAY